MKMEIYKSTPEVHEIGNDVDQAGQLTTHVTEDAVDDVTALGVLVYQMVQQTTQSF